MFKLESDYSEASGRVGSLVHERDELVKQLQRESEERSELEDQRERLILKNEELGEQVNELQIRLGEEEHQSQKATDELKKLGVG